MTNCTRLLAPAALAILAVLPASAQTRDVPGRFTMQPIEGGFLRLDTQTGAVSTCRTGSGNLVLCQPAQEESQGLAKEIERLRTENLDLRAEIKRLQTAAVPGAPSQPPVAEPPGKEKFQLPSEEDVDGALDYVERMFKKFRDRLRSLEEDNKKPGTL
ncbi:MAG: hypothetical protein J0I57_19640 [Hyphomicrobium sp.]|uniref:hypothetical protein n=1 Tax=Hyphomicrobium sp. CS1BSMeth3 TaxID=1892844 RepID=UPI0009306968|nr:hypothetical protein [Hyphomicrobium sp. CS1BSMeth3]MBN9260484.1 hypothetical protein [Hyphomicrobium sp.]MBN9279826.1 hypothetical protein [Hyphomicrobium sp.]